MGALRPGGTTPATVRTTAPVPTNTTAPVPFTGWHRRPGSRWVKLAEADTETRTWAALLDALAEQGGRGGESVVLPGGRTPPDDSIRPTQARYPRRAST
jgi:hypothetical protein